jgi:hypothetical protein
MFKQLIVTSGPDQGLVFLIPPADTLLLGRSRATETRLTDPHVSRLHCRVEAKGDDVVITDNDSAGGTYVNGRRISGPHIVRPGDTISVGQTELQLRTVSADDADTVPPRSQPTAAPQPPAEVGGLPLAELVGQTISRYRIGSVLAKGQHGVVFHARDTEADLPVAFKVLGPRLADDETRRERFVRAMKTVLPLRHENLVTVHAAGKTGRFCWIAMEYVEGESLTQWVQRAGVAGMLDWRNAVRVAVQIARALEYAHAQQILHRNVTPMNVVVRGRDKVAKLGDLMLAKALEGALAVNLTEPGEMLSDLDYIAPERTYPSATCDERSDLFSLGATLYALLTGRLPFAGDSPIETIKKVRAAQPDSPRKAQMAVPQQVEDVVLKLLARRPEDRYANATALLRELERMSGSV